MVVLDFIGALPFVVFVNLVLKSEVACVVACGFLNACVHYEPSDYLCNFADVSFEPVFAVFGFSAPLGVFVAVESLSAGFSFVEVAACLAGLVQENVFTELFCLYADSDIVIGNLNNSFVFAFSGDVFAVPALEEPAV